MSNNLLRELLENSMSTMSKEELTRAILSGSDEHVEAMVRVIVMRKGKDRKSDEGSEVVTAERVQNEEITRPAAHTEGRHVEKRMTNMDTTEVAKEQQGGNVGKQLGTVPPKIVTKCVPKNTAAALKGNSAVGTGKSNKRGYDEIDLTTDDQDEAHAPVPITTPATTQTLPTDTTHQGNITPDGLRTMLMHLRGESRVEMQRTAKALDQLKWDQIKSRRDLITALTHSEKVMPGGGPWNLETFNAMRNNMERWVEDQYERLENHPMFAAAYHMDEQQNPVNPGQENGQGSHPALATTNLPETFSVRPPFDWRAMEIHSLENTPGGMPDDHVISQAFCESYAEIIQLATLGNTSTSKSLKDVVPLVERLARLAHNMAYAPPRRLQRKLMMGDSLAKLRACLFAVCGCIGRRAKLDSENELDEKQRQFIREELCWVENVLKVRYVRLDWRSGLDEVIHLL